MRSWHRLIRNSWCKEDDFSKRRRKNMKHSKKILVALLLGIVCLTGCSENTNSSENRRRFFVLSSDMNFYVVCDRTTGVEYAVSRGLYNCGTVTLLVDAEGKPLIYEGDK
jgi:hypothetical protein